MNVRSEPKSISWLNRFAWFAAFATLLLICSGGMVTSKGVGLAVPDWPTTFGYNMFLFPASKWIGGIFFEHTHRLIASTVGFLTIILAAWLWFIEPRRWVRILGIAAVGAVILQGVLGGLGVTMLKDEIGLFPAVLAQAFFVSAHRESISPFRGLSTAWLIGVLVQLTLGAWTIWSNKAADVATTHAAVGATLLGLGAIICAFCFRQNETPSALSPSRRVKSDPVIA